MIRRKPKPWASQLIFFDVVLYNARNTELSRRAAFICKHCRYLCEWDKESLVYRCGACGRKLTVYGAQQIVDRYYEQINNLKVSLSRRERDVIRNENVAKRIKPKRPRN